MPGYAIMGAVSVERFAAELRTRRGLRKLTQDQLADLAGVSKQLIEKLENQGRTPPRTGRMNAADLAHALGWEPDLALGLLGYPPLSDDEREVLGPSAHWWNKLQRLWPQLSIDQQSALTNLVQSIVVPAAVAPDITPRDPVSDARNISGRTGTAERRRQRLAREAKQEDGG